MIAPLGGVVRPPANTALSSEASVINLTNMAEDKNKRRTGPVILGPYNNKNSNAEVLRKDRNSMDNSNVEW